MPAYLPEGNQPRPTDTPDRALQKINGVLLDGLGVAVSNGQKGFQHIGGTVSTSGNWYALQILTDTKFHTLTGNGTGLANTALGSAVEVPAGTALFGSFTTIQLHSGSLNAYHA